MKVLAIDGACKRNGQPDCVSSFCVVECDDTSIQLHTGYELESTSQRGEILGLLKAMEISNAIGFDSCLIITDSEYIYNTVFNEWPVSWRAKGWKKADGDPVANQDLWKRYLQYFDSSYPIVNIYHIHGHCVSLGEKTGIQYLNAGNYALKERLELAIEQPTSRRTKERYIMAYEAFKSKYSTLDLTFKNFVVLNGMADIAAKNALLAAIK